MKPVIALIGAGSTSFTVSVVKDIILSDGLQDCTLRLMDIDATRLYDAQQAAESYLAEAASGIRIEAHLDRHAALDGADFVICAVKIGGYEPLEAERAIAEAHGYYRGIGDRVSCYFGGIGAYWQIRFLAELAADMLSLCPEAWLVQTANPVLDGTNYLTRHTGIKAAGVCHGHFQAYAIADILGLDRDKVSAEMSGLNHYIFLTDFRYEGKDAYPLLDQWIEDKSEAYWQSEAYNTPGVFGFLPEELCPGAIDAYRLYGLMPIGDTIRSASPWWHHENLATKEKWYGAGGGFDSEICWKQYLSQKDDHQAKIRAAMESGESMTTVSPLTPSGEQHIPLINAMVTDRYERLTLNIRNDGCLPGIPDDVIVETPAMVSARGIQGIKQNALPRRILDNIIFPRICTMNNLHDAYEQGDRMPLVLELMRDPRTRSLKQAQNLIDELLRQPWNADADRHYR